MLYYSLLSRRNGVKKTEKWLWWAHPGWMPGVHQAALSVPSAGQSREIQKRVETGADVSHQLPSWGQQILLGKKLFNLLPIKS